ncbi:MAG: glycerate kinase type-2 family protein [Vicinamibacterales bacterium]
MRASVEAVSAARLLERAMGEPELHRLLTRRPLHVLAVGKAAAAMSSAFVAMAGLDIRGAVAIGTHAGAGLPPGVEWIPASHPFPDERSERAARRAIDLAQRIASDEALVVLLSGGASALMCAPLDGITLAEKVATTKMMMDRGADIVALNTVRRHLSRVKGGRLAEACQGLTVTLAISDVVGDDLNAIGSGPGVSDPTTWSDAASALAKWGGLGSYPSVVVTAVERGVAGQIPDTPKPDQSVASRIEARVIGSRSDAVAGAAQEAERRGYRSFALSEPVVGEARVVARTWLDRAQELAESATGPACVVSAGETTVRVTGTGRGGRNLEFALALVEPLAAAPRPMAVASAGTDGIDGSSGVAGGMADATTLSRARQLGLKTPTHYLNANDSLSFFTPLNDVIRLGRTDTNVGDVQVLLLGRPK